MRICLDPGHGGSDPGASGNGLLEKNMVLLLALKVGQDLIQQNIEVIYTRATDVFIGINERASIANRNACDLFVSFHLNAFSQASANGYETFFARGLVPDEAFARIMQNKIDSLGLFRSRGVKNDTQSNVGGLGVLRNTNMPAILLEVGFITNAQDMEILNQNFDLICKNITDGILLQLGVERVQGDLEDSIPEWQFAAFRKLQDHNVITTPEFWDTRLGDNIRVGEVFALLANMLPD